MYRYRLYDSEGNDQGEAHYVTFVAAGETIRTGDGRLLRVLDIVPTYGDESARYVGLLKIEAA